MRKTSASEAHAQWDHICHYFWPKNTSQRCAWHGSGLCGFAFYTSAQSVTHCSLGGTMLHISHSKVRYSLTL